MLHFSLEEGKSSESAEIIRDAWHSRFLAGARKDFGSSKRRMFSRVA